MKKVSKIKTFEDACKVLKLNPKSLPGVSLLPKKHRKAIIAYYKLFIIAEALNEGWKPNWKDSSEYKYYPCFYVKANSKSVSGVGLSHDYGHWHSTTNVGSRLYYRTSEIAEYAGKKFKSLYEDAYLLLN